MKPAFFLVFGSWIAGILISPLWAVADAMGADDPIDPAAYYGWLDKYQNPEKQPVIAPAHKAESASQQTAPSESPVPPRAAAVLPHTDGAPEESQAGEVVFEQAEAGEGLGCYYHRSYYSHLPMFKEGAYHLPGSLDVAEPYQKASSNVISSPAAPTP